MAHFYASIQGNRGEATRMGTKNSGMTSHTRGWNVGVRVYMSVNRDGEDICTIYLTSGSSGHKLSKFIGDFTIKDLEG
ncbi:unnamed protein product [marine sediment metagenome]|uniref:Uncharacterized protein n=1 Tax=marine sediment metagenome TaxID=412755 RepID=X0U6C9_9ZZZZ